MSNIFDLGSIHTRDLRELAEDIAKSLRYGKLSGRNRHVAIDRRGRVYLEHRENVPPEDWFGYYGVVNEDQACLKRAPARTPEEKERIGAAWRAVIAILEEDLRAEAQERQLGSAS